MTTHPINPLARGGFLVTVKRPSGITKVKYVQPFEEAEDIEEFEDYYGSGEVTITPKGGAE